ncbi:MAG: hypothetical protein ABW167_05245 [Baekduia sp.]
MTFAIVLKPARPDLCCPVCGSALTTAAGDDLLFCSAWTQKRGIICDWIGEASMAAHAFALPNVVRACAPWTVPATS